MPFDLNTWKRYDVDFDLLCACFENGVYESTRFRDRAYFSEWFGRLKKADDGTAMEILHKYGDQARSGNMDRYDMSVAYSYKGAETELRLNFMVDRAISAVRSSEQPVHEIDIRKFGQSDEDFDSLIEYNRPEESELDLNYPENHEPVILVQFPSAGHLYFVVDGNHRVCMNKKRGRDRVRAYFMNEKQVVLHKIMGTEFDKLFYIFVNETLCIQTFPLKSREIVLNSYLHTGRVETIEKLGFVRNF